MRLLPRFLWAVPGVCWLAACGNFQGPACPLGPPCPPPASARAPETLYGVIYSVLQVRRGTTGGAADAPTRAAETYHVTVTLKDGSRVILQRPDIGTLRLGDRVRIDDGEISRY